MSLLQTAREGLTDDSLRFAILVGLATVPFTIALSWEPVSNDVVRAGGTVSGGPLVLAGLLVGYCYSDRAVESRRAGIWTGLASSIGVVIVFLASAVTTIGAVSARYTVVVAVLTPVLVVIGVGFTVLVTVVCAAGCDWITKRVDSDRRKLDNEAAGGASTAVSRWWLSLVVYAIVAPVVFIYVGWSRPASGAEFALSFLGVLFLVVVSMVTLVGLFIDATTPRSVKTDWFPNVWAYVGFPLAFYALVYVVAGYQGLSYPPGYAMYGFFGAVWVTAVVYLAVRHRAIGTPTVGNSSSG